MLHNHPPTPCWCGEKHTRGQVYNLNVSGRWDLPPDTGPETMIGEELTGLAHPGRRRRIMARTPDGDEDRLDAAVREAGGWNAVTDGQIDQLIEKQREKDTESEPE